MSSFNYNSVPIDSSKQEIRLVEILPANQEPEVHPLRVQSRMKCASLIDSPAYTALSYTWGGGKKPILLGCKEVSVTANLESALYHLRHPSVIVTLWVDAICINQSNTKEKNEQIRMMKQIYQAANHVMVWLGPSYGDSDLAFDVMNQIGKAACDIGFWKIPRKSWLEAWSNRSGLYSQIHQLVEEKLFLDHAYEAIVRLTNRPWWYRVWVVQEFVVPRVVSFTCGFSSISFENFAAALPSFAMGLLKLADEVKVEDWADPIKKPKLTRVFTNSMSSRPSSMIGSRRKYHDDSGSHDALIQLLRRAYSVSSSLNGLDATEPQDRIFGMLGLASDTDQLGVYPECEKSPEAVYINTARTLLQHGHTDILLLSQFPKILNLPSWVPDWTAKIQEPCGECLIDARFSASGQIPFSSVPIGSSVPNDLIALKGTRVDTISQVGAPWLPAIVGYKHNWPQSVTFITDIQSFCDQSDRLAQSTQPIYKSPKQREEAVWRIPCGDMHRNSDIGRSRALANSPDVLAGFRLLKAGFESDEAKYAADLRLHSYTTSMGDMFKRRPFLSAQGYVGLVPSRAQIGDIIVIIYGAIVPFVIRHSDEGRFKFIGEAYVHGIMDGEYVEMSPSTETFTLH
jgi:Heterokaryon incompatibility protein (HET)